MHSCGYNQVRGAAAALSAGDRKKIKTQTHSSLCFQEPAARTERLRVSSVQRVAERRGEACEGGCMDRKDVSYFFLSFPFSVFFFGHWQEPPATRSAFNYRWRMMLALFLSVMSCTCKLQNILKSHHCPLISSLTLFPLSSAGSKMIKLYCTGGQNGRGGLSHWSPA